MGGYFRQMLGIFCSAAKSVTLRRKLLGAFCAVLVLSAVPEGAGGLPAAQAALVIHAPDGRTVIPPGFEQEPIDLPRDAEEAGALLGEEDAARYRRIFALQQGAEWDAADAEIDQLSDKRLLGYVLRQRYLHPDRRARYDELAAWMQRYGDLAGADRIYALAQRRQPAGQRAPKPPQGAGERLAGSLERLGGYKPEPVAAEVLAEENLEDGEGSRAETAEAEEAAKPVTVAPRSRATRRASTSGGAAVARVKELLSAGKTAAALALLGEDSFGRNLDPVQYDTARARIAAALYYEGSVKQALALASASAARSGAFVEEANWIAGLSAWRMGQHDRAARHFDALAEAQPRSPWLASAAGYWAARAHAKKGRHDKARAWLAAAARYPHTFYGLIAQRTLGGVNDLHWQLPELTAEHLRRLTAEPAGARAVALLQTGQKDFAEAELRRVHPRGDRLVEEALIALADRAGLAALALQAGNAVAGPDGSPYTAALYPLPHWTPRDGFVVDRALLFAVMRQESRFNPRLISSAGATGLMQIMPGTAVHVQQRNAEIDEDDTGRSALFDPATNMELGQRYLAELLSGQYGDNNLFYVFAAYNAGPGNLNRWRRELAEIEDPLLFIESIPFGETRHYVERVLANFWIYRIRLGQETGSLDAVAAGGWPVYMPVDASPAARTEQVAQNAED